MSYDALADRGDARHERVSLFTHTQILNGSAATCFQREICSTVKAGGERQGAGGGGGGGGEVKRLREKRLCSFSPKDLLILHVHVAHLVHHASEHMATGIMSIIDAASI